MHQSDGNSSYGEPVYWRFDYPFKILQTAFWLWSMSGFQRMPTQDEVLEYDDRYLSDMKLLYNIYAHQGNQSLVMRLFEQHEQFNKNPNMWRQKQAFESQQDVTTNDSAFERVQSGGTTYARRKS